MTDTTQILNPGGAQSFKMLRAMVGIALVCAFLIAFTFESTLERIAFNKAEALEKAIFEVIPDINTKESFSFDGEQFLKTTVEETSDSRFYAGYDQNGKMNGIAIEASGMGFADIIKILYAYDPENEELIGFKVLESKETPGLGDKIEKEDRFLQNFDHLDVELDKEKFRLRNQVVTVKQGHKKNNWEIDGITGATITSKAIGEIIDQSSSKWIPEIYQRISDFEKNDSNINE